MSTSITEIKTGRIVRIKYNMDHNITKFSRGLVLSGNRNLSICLGFIAMSFSNANIEGLMESITT
jgi:hypothetical protein